MANTKRFAFNVLMNWAAVAVGMVVPFFLTPFVVRHLGSAAYGVWILAVSTVAYLNLLDLGLRSAVIRFVSKADAEGNLEDAQAAIGAALWFRLLISAVVVVISILLALSFPHLFKVPSDLRRASQITVLMCALGIAVTLISGVFGAVLAAIHRFDILSWVTVMQTLARAGGVLLLLRSGRGLVALAYWEFTVVLLTGLVTAAIALKMFPASRVPVRRPRGEILKAIWSYSFTTFVLIIAVQVIINTDNLAVGAFLSVGLVAFYSIGSSLVSYSSQVSSAVSTTFAPLASNLEASGQFDELRKLLIRGTQGTLALMLPISVALLFRGKTFIGLWVGQEYSETSGTVLQILMIAQFFSVASSTAGAIMMAIGKHKPVAKWAVIEALVNLGLSLVLVETVGLYGVAWGTSLSTAVIYMIFWPRYVHKILGVSVGRFLWEGWTKVTLCVVPYGIASILADRFWHAPNMIIFFGQILATLPVYVICLLLVFRNDAHALFQKWRQSRRVQAEATL
ncbi:polysaccharide biosynthesis C-terminal domain-containing protein [Edaphobacter paludis]|uniref:Polysaccharide biosynthesis C-terminal domain-containing protein n=1 Tax=Edaphobacter paludis TaxID=3035702 RepID=A0AAU7D7A4_9BACT